MTRAREGRRGAGDLGEVADVGPEARAELDDAVARRDEREQLALNARHARLVLVHVLQGIALGMRRAQGIAVCGASADSASSHSSRVGTGFEIK